MARNEARLRELGLLQPESQPAPIRSRSTTRRKSSSRTEQSSEPLRRSTRSSTRSQPLPEKIIDPVEPRSKRPRKVAKEEPERVVNSVFPPSSVRSMVMDVNALVYGNMSFPGGVLGMCMERTGKAFVMDEAVRRCLPDCQVSKLSFNKYCGVQEWKNDALFLWVNLGSPQSDVVNDFLEGGRKITWFGGSRMHEESNVIRRLIRVGKKAASDGRLDSREGLVLWCRTYDPAKRTHSPYTCLGRLSYVEHEVGSHPLKFVWKLIDFDRLVQREQEQQSEIFRSMIMLS